MEDLKQALSEEVTRSYHRNGQKILYSTGSPRLIDDLLRVIPQTGYTLVPIHELDALERVYAHVNEKMQETIDAIDTGKKVQWPGDELLGSWGSVEVNRPHRGNNHVAG